MPSVGQKRRVEMTDAIPTTCHWMCFAAGRLYTEQTASWRREEDDVIFAPGTGSFAEEASDIAYVFSRTTVQLHLLQFSIVEKCDVPAIGRPKEISCVGAGQ